MKNTFRKIISLLLALIMLLSVPVSAFAKDESAPEYDGYPLILIRGMDFNGIYYKLGTEDEQRCFKGIEALPLIKALALSVFGGVAYRSMDVFIDELCVYLNDIMGLMACNKDGSSRYDISVQEYPLSLANYPESAEWGEDNEMGILQTACEKMGAEKVPHGDAGYEFELLDGYRMQIMVYEGDDEFAPTSQILYSDNFADSFAAEDRVVAGDILISAIKAKL